MKLHSQLALICILAATVAASAAQPAHDGQLDSPAPKADKDKPAKDDKDKDRDKQQGPSQPSAKPAQPKASASAASSPATPSSSSSSSSNKAKSKSAGASHYLASKHDAYSAIAEKHGSLGTELTRRTDKRRYQSFGGIQKASGGLGEYLSPLKGVSDTGLARTLGASVRGIMKSKYSVPAYVASALLGAVALLAFYESPISPLPVPALPSPPVGRFPPEMPMLPPNVQIPFKTNQNYNQRSFNAGQQQQQQVYFPSQAPSGQQFGLASMMAKSQVAQRKSSPDFESQPSLAQLSGVGQLVGLGVNTQASGGSLVEPKSQPVSLSSSHLINKFKSYFNKPVSPSPTPYSQYHRMSLVEALIKDTSFSLPKFLAPSSRKSSPPTGASTTNQSPFGGQQQANAVSQPINPTARMQLGEPTNPQQQPAKQKSAVSGGGLVRAADKIAHALFETFTSGMMQRSSDPASGRKSSDDGAASATHQAASLISTRVANYNPSSSAGPIKAEPAGPAQPSPSSSLAAPQAGSLASQASSSQVSSSSPKSEASASGELVAKRYDSSSSSAPGQEGVSADSSAAQTGEKVRKTRSIGIEYPVEVRDEQSQRPSRAAQINSVIDFVADSYSQNRLLFNFFMNQVGLSHAVPYVEQILANDQQKY